MNERLTTASQRLCELLISKGKTITTAESCTGGLVASSLTSVSGASACFEYGFVTYSNSAKQNLLCVNQTTLKTHSAISSNTALEMAQGALKVSGADVALAVTGNAGPNASEGKEVGLIYVSVMSKDGKSVCRQLNLKGDRDANRKEAAAILVEMAIEYIQST